MRVLVCGGRYYKNRGRVYQVLDAIHRGSPIVLIIHGEATGADRLGRDWALQKPVAHQGFRADWFNLGKAAGPIRNQRMIDEANPDLVVAFPGGRGTADMVRRATTAKITIIKVDWT